MSPEDNELLEIAGASKLHDWVMLSVKGRGILYLDYREGSFVPVAVWEPLGKKRPITDADSSFIETVLAHETSQQFIRYGLEEREGQDRQ